MNLLLLEEGDFVAADRVRLRDRRLTHMRDVHRVEVNESSGSAGSAARWATVGCCA